MRVRFIAALLGLSACGPEVEELDLGVDVQLNDAASVHPYADEFIAVGAGGLIVDHRGRTWTIAETDLRAAAWDRSYERWWVVGDAGLVAIADARDDGELEWVRLDPGTDANLHAIALWEGESQQVVVVGDDTLLVGTAFMPFNYLWTEPEPPEGGWGRLRDVEFMPVNHSGPTQLFEPSLWAVGERGRMLSSYGEVDRWVVEQPGVDVHLTCVSAHWAAGADGTFVSRTSWLDPWTVIHAQPEVDLLDCSRQFIGDDRRIYEFDEWAKAGPRLEPLIRLDWQPRGFNQHGDLIVGDGGHVARWRP